jgi:hypothetical protein
MTENSALETVIRRKDPLVAVDKIELSLLSTR